MDDIDQKATTVVNEGGGECPVNDMKEITPLISESKRQELLAKSILATLAKA